VAELSRRQLLAAGLGGVGAVAAGGALREAYALLEREDLIPGEPVQRLLAPEAWETTERHLEFAAIGDNGSGGRQAVAVADRMAQTYEVAPFGLVSLLGDICYYGSIEERFDDVFLRPMSPLIDAGVEFELAVGNHDEGLYENDVSLAEMEATLDLLGTPGRYHASTHGPADFFYLDSSNPAVLGDVGDEQLEWLDDVLSASTNQWKIVAFHHPVYSSGLHGSTPRLNELLEPLLARHHVDLVLTGHDHHYERTVPIQGITYVVSGGGCKTTPVRPRGFTAAAASALEFLHVVIDDDRLVGRAVGPLGESIDEFELRAREGR
jgi:3',5'-cyclic AMP phosphodiesterase CpdA